MADSEFRPISRLAIVAAAGGIMSLASFLFAPLVVLALATATIGLISHYTIRKYELSGSALAVAAIIVSATVVTIAPLWHRHQFNSESLPGHTRIDFGATQGYELDRYDGQLVCLKGYPLWLGDGSAGDRFLLSPDGRFPESGLGITVIAPAGWPGQGSAVAASGVLRVDSSADNPQDRYTLSAVKISTVNTDYMLAPRMPSDC